MALTYHEDGSSTKSIDERQTAKKNPKSKGDPEKPYWKDLPGAPVGQNLKLASHTVNKVNEE